MKRLLALATIGAAASVLVATAPPASAIECPPGWQPTSIYVGSTFVARPCLPVFHCDPAACFPAAPTE